MRLTIGRFLRVGIALFAIGSIATLAAPKHPGFTPYDATLEKLTVQTAHADCNDHLCVREGEFKACWPDEFITCVATVVNGQPSCFNQACE